MKKTPKKSMCILVLAFIIIFGITNKYANGADILLIGTFISPDEKGNTKTYELWTDDKKWRFTVTKAIIMSGAAVNGWRVLAEIRPKKIKLIGEESLIAPLKQPRIVGKTFKLRGDLHVEKKRYHLNVVREVVEKKSPEQEKDDRK